MEHIKELLISVSPLREEIQEIMFYVSMHQEQRACWQITLLPALGK